MEGSTLYKSEYGKVTLECMDEDDIRVVFYDSDNNTIDFLWVDEDTYSFAQNLSEFNRYMEEGRRKLDEATVFTQYVADVFGKNVIYNATLCEYVKAMEEHKGYTNRVGNHVIIFK